MAEKRKTEETEFEQRSISHAFGARHRTPQAIHVFEHISASGNSRQHVGNNFNAVSLNIGNEDEQKETRALEALHFPDIDNRRDSIGYASARTFEWLLSSDTYSYPEILARAYAIDASETEKGLSTETTRIRTGAESAQKQIEQRMRSSAKLRTWLERGDKVFWITGKAASGKTTLMKFLRNSDSAGRLLDSWASNSTLVIADHYFWYPGSALQKSHEGLYRTILFKIFRARPSFIKVAWPSRWNMDRLGDPISGSAFYEAIANLDAHGVRMCFFIDALDEYHPQCDQYLLLEVVNNLTRLGNVKICVSSRPWQIFEDHFGDSEQSFTLEDINRLDIEQYIVTTLRQQTSRTPIGSEFKAPMTHRAAAFVEYIAMQAEGVFLWVFLVLQRIATKIRFVQHLTDLQQMVSRFPPELDKYFRDLIYERISPAWKESSETAAVLLIMLTGLRASRYYWHVVSGEALEDPLFGMTQSVQFYPDSWFDLSLQRTVDFVRSCCLDLVSVIRHRPRHQASSWDSPIFDFAHRTISDFLHSEGMQTLLKAHAPKHFHQIEKLIEQVSLGSCKIMSNNRAANEVYSEICRELSSIMPERWETAEHLIVAQECQRVALAVVRHYGRKLRLPFTDADDENEHYRLLRKISFYGLQDFARHILDSGSINYHWKASIMEGVLALEYRHESQTIARQAIGQIRVSNVEVVIDLGGDPDYYAPYSTPDGLFVTTASGRTIWHDFLFWWWCLDPRRRWTEYRFDYTSRKASWKKPDREDIIPLPDQMEPESTRLWRIAKLLIERGASTHGKVCLTTANCPVGRLVPKHFYWRTPIRGFDNDPNEHSVDACFELDTVEVLKHLVPASCLVELEDVLLMVDEAWDVEI